MLPAEKAQVDWDDKKKNWTIRIHVGGEVIKRLPDTRLARDSADEALRAAAVRTAAEDGYELPLENVTVQR